MSTLMESPLSRDLARMRRRINRFFEEPLDLALAFRDEGAKAADRQWWSPTVEVTESPAEFLVTAELPGISPESVEVQVGDGVLTLKGTKSDERKHEDKDRRYHVWEREYGSFERSFRFPAEVDEAKVEASHTNGVLRIKVPKAAPSASEVRTIPIAKK